MNLQVHRDNEGFLVEPEQWSVQLAHEIAKEENIELDDDHWIVVNFIRDYFDDKQTVPETRFALKHLRGTLGDERGTRKYLHTLFPYGYGQQACKIAGMRKPLKLMLDV